MGYDTQAGSEFSRLQMAEDNLEDMGSTGSQTEDQLNVHNDLGFLQCIFLSQVHPCFYKLQG